MVKGPTAPEVDSWESGIMYRAGRMLPPVVEGVSMQSKAEKSKAGQLCGVMHWSVNWNSFKLQLQGCCTGAFHCYNHKATICLVGMLS